MHLSVELSGYGKIRRIKPDTTHLALAGGHLQGDRLQPPHSRRVLRAAKSNVTGMPMSLNQPVKAGG